MPGAAIVAAALTTGASRKYALWLDGLDVIAEPATPARYWVPLGSVSPTLVSPGGVSSLTFDIEDPLALLTVADGMGVILERFLFSQARLFRGWVSAWSMKTRRGNQGRTFSVECVGAESLLDWAVTTVAITFGTVLGIGTMAQQLVAISTCSGLAELRAIADPVNLQGSQTGPIGANYVGSTSFSNQDESGNVIPVTIAAGTTLREAIAAAGRACGIYGNFYVTVDQTFGLRIWIKQAPGVSYHSPHAGTGLVIALQATTTGGLDYPTKPTYAVDASGIVRRVLVRGTGVSAWSDDGTGKPGRTAVLDDANITTAAQARAAGASYIADNAGGIRGSVSVEDSTAYAFDAEMSLRGLQITDPSLGLTGSPTMQITSMALRFYGSKIDADLAYGGLEPSGANLLRQLTRGTLS